MTAVAEKVVDLELPEGSIPVLDKGFARLVDSMGGDDRIVQTARVSYGAGTKTVRKDRALIHYLLRHKHTSPFEQVQFTFHVKMPIFVARQWIRHRTAKLNEISGRYSVMKDEFYVPPALAYQSKDNKQGSGMALSDEDAAPILEELAAEQERAYDFYTDMVDIGVAKESARINLPLSIYTEMYWTIDLHNLMHFLRLRLDSHAQYEIRAYAQALYDLAEPIAPVAFEAFEEYVRGGVTIPKTEFELLREFIHYTYGGVDMVLAAAEEKGIEGGRLKELETLLALPK